MSLIVSIYKITNMVDAVDGYVNHNKGKDMSDEQKQKISETLKKRSQLGAS